MMGIREEIGKLKMADTMLDRLTGHAFTAMQERNNTLDDILSILDKWECIGEKTFYYAGWAMLQEGDFTDSKPVLPGDHIIIWRRKDE